MNDNKKILSKLLKDDKALCRAVLGAETLEEAYTEKAVMGLIREEFLHWVQEIPVKNNPCSDESMDMSIGNMAAREEVFLSFYNRAQWQTKSIEWEDKFLHYTE